MANASIYALCTAVAIGLFNDEVSAQGWNASLTLTTDYIVRGITRSEGDPSAQLDLHRDFRSGWLVGLSAATSRLGPEEPISAELSPYLGYRQSFGNGWQGQVAAAHYDYPGSSSRDRYRYDEISTAVGWRNRLFLDLSVLPDTSIESKYGKASGRPAFAAGVSGHAPLAEGWSFNAGLGYYDLHDLIGVGYPYWNAGVACDFGVAQLDLSYLGSNATAKSLYYDNRAGQRWAATLIWHFF